MVLFRRGGRGIWLKYTILFLVLFINSLLAYGEVGTVDNFKDESNPFNITFLADEIQQNFLEIPIYSEVENISLNLNGYYSFNSSKLFNRWTLDNIITDSVGNNHFTDVSTLLYDDPRNNNTLNFDKSGLFNETTLISQEHILFNENKSLCLYFKTNGSIDQMPIITDGTFDSNEHWTIRIQADGTIRALFEVSNTDYHITSIDSFDTNEWFLMCFSYDANTNFMVLYINQSLQGTVDISSHLDNIGALKKVYLGADSEGGSNKFKGHIDDIRVYKKALLIGDVNNIYNEYKPYSISNLNITLDNQTLYYKSGMSNHSVNFSLDVSEINNILNDGCVCENCSIEDNYCNVPINFYSETAGILNITITNSTYNYGIDDCSIYTYPVYNITYYDEITTSPIFATTQYNLNVVSPFSQEITGTFSNVYSNTFCSLANNTLEYDVSGSFNVQKSGYESKIIQANEENPFIFSYNPITNYSVYLTDTTNASQVTFTVKNFVTKNLLSNVNIYMYQFLDGSYQLINQKQTDITGKSVFDYIEDKEYLFNFSKSSYTTLSTILNPITSATYDVFLTPDRVLNESEPMSRVIITATPQVFYEGNNNITINIYSPYDELLYYSYYIEYPGGTGYDIGAIDSGETFVYNFNIVGASLFDSVRLKINYSSDLIGVQSNIYEFEILQPAGNYTMIHNKNETYGLGLFERLFISIFIVLLIVGLSTLMSQTVSGLFIGFTLFGYFVYIGFIPIWSILISIFVLLILLSGRSK